MPNTLWDIPQRRPSACTHKTCDVCPVYTTGVPLDALKYSKDWKPVKTSTTTVYNKNYYYPGYYGSEASNPDM